MTLVSVLALVGAFSYLPSAAAAPRQAPGGASEAAASASQATGTSVQFEQDKDYGTAERATVSSKTAANQYISGRGWSSGRNGKGESSFLLFIGTGPIVEGDPSTFDQRRLQAVEEAMLRAKQGLVEMLAAEVSTRVKLEYTEGTPPLDEIANAATPAAAEPGAFEKLNAILNHEINEELKKRNIDPSLQTPEQKAQAAAAAKEAARVILGSTEFSDAVEILAEHELAGLQAFRTFESVDKNGTGDVSVVAIYSSKTEALQQALLGLRPAPTGAPKQNIGVWAKEQSAETLLYTYGVQIRTNENGEMVLVGFGQATPIGKGARQLSAASEKAQADAMKQLRRFMGELVRSRQSDAKASSVKDFADETSQFKSTSQFTESIEAIGASLGMSGMTEVYTWQLQHPQSDRPSVGTVYVWSVSEALAANALSDRLRDTSAASGGPGITNKRATEPKQPAAKPASGGGNPSSGQGAEGETP